MTNGSVLYYFRLLLEKTYYDTMISYYIVGARDHAAVFY